MTYDEKFQQAADEVYDENQQWEIEEKKNRARELMEGFQYLQQEQNQINEQRIIRDEGQKVLQELGLSPEEQAQIQQALSQNPGLNEKAIRKSVRKRVDTILKGVRHKNIKTGQLVSKKQGPQQEVENIQQVKQKHHERRTAGTTQELRDVVDVLFDEAFWGKK
jgi:hypothetical protein